MTDIGRSDADERPDALLVGEAIRRRRSQNAGDLQGAWGFLRDFPALIPYLKRHWLLAIGSVSMIGVGSLVALIAPWPLAIVLDSVLGNKPLPAILGSLFNGSSRNLVLIFAVVFAVVVAALQHGASVAENYINTKLEQQLILDFRSDLFRHTQRLSLAFHDTISRGTLMYKLNNEADATGTIVVAVPALIQALITVVLMVFVSVRIDPVLTLVALGVVPFIYYSAGYYTKRIEPRLITVRNLEGQSLSIVYEAMAMLRVVISFGREGHEYRRFRNQGEAAVRARVGLTVRQTLFSLGVGMITAVGSALVLGLGAHHVLQHRLTAGELMVMLGYIAAIYSPLEQISQSLSTLQQHFIAFRYALDLLEEEPEIEDAPGAIDVGRAKGQISFRNVDFAYAGRDQTLSGISFDVAAGQRVALVGPTGAGKTTIVSLMLRFYDPSRGQILLDGVDLRHIRVYALRDQIALVLQEPLLFSGTIFDNILYGRLDAGEEDVYAAARAANAHDFIEKLPQGYSTTLGERGAQLSGGERQRICVARAFLKDAPILVLDEPTSSIDSKTEAVILDALDRLMEGRTSFMIAHRLSTIHEADVILVLDKGCIVQRGTHEELRESDGMYRQLWLAQAGQERRRQVVESDGRKLDATRHLLPGESTSPAQLRTIQDPEAARALVTLVSSNGTSHASATVQAGAASLLLRAVLSLIEQGSDSALKQLAAKSDDRKPEIRLAAELASRVIREADITTKAAM
jgi:ATP-binding cassette, subfamily B, bacterial